MNKERIAALALTAAITFGAASCSKQVETVDPTPPPSASETVTPETTPSQKPVEVSPSPKIENIAVTPEELDARLALAPEIPGLAKKIESNKVVYFSQEGNEYGLEANMYAGVFTKEVFVEGNEVGGVSLVSEVAKKLLQDKLDSISDPAEKMALIVPVDFSKLDFGEEFKIINTNDSTSNKDSILFQFGDSNTLDLYNVVGDSQSFAAGTRPISLNYHLSDGSETNLSVMVLTNLENFDPNKTKSEMNPMSFLHFVVSEKSVESNYSANNLLFGDRICPVKSFFTVHNYLVQYMFSITTDNLTTIDGKVVSITSHQTGR